MVAGLKGNVEGRTGGKFSSSVNGVDFCVGATDDFVKTGTDQLAVFNYNGPDHWIR